MARFVNLKSGYCKQGIETSFKLGYSCGKRDIAEIERMLKALIGYKKTLGSLNPLLQLILRRT